MNEEIRRSNRSEKNGKLIDEIDPKDLIEPLSLIETNTDVEAGLLTIYNWFQSHFIYIDLDLDIKRLIPPSDYPWETILQTNFLSVILNLFYSDLEARLTYIVIILIKYVLCDLNHEHKCFYEQEFLERIKMYLKSNDYEITNETLNFLYSFLNYPDGVDIIISNGIINELDSINPEICKNLNIIGIIISIINKIVENKISNIDLISNFYPMMLKMYLEVPNDARRLRITSIKIIYKFINHYPELITELFQYNFWELSVQILPTLKNDFLSDNILLIFLDTVKNQDISIEAIHSIIDLGMIDCIFTKNHFTLENVIAKTIDSDTYGYITSIIRELILRNDHKIGNLLSSYETLPKLCYAASEASFQYKIDSLGAIHAYIQNMNYDQIKFIESSHALDDIFHILSNIPEEVVDDFLRMFLRYVEICPTSIPIYIENGSIDEINEFLSSCNSTKIIQQLEVAIQILSQT